MTRASALLSPRVAIGRADERLAELARRITDKRAHFCVVLDPDNGRFRGLLRLSDFAERTNASQRLLGDLLGPREPLRVRDSEAAAEIALLFAEHDVDEAVVLNAADEYVGLITAESVQGWRLGRPPGTAETAGESAGVPGEAARSLALAYAQREDLPELARAAFLEIAALLPTGPSAPAASVTRLRGTPAAPSRVDPLSPAGGTRGPAGVILLIEDHAASRAALAGFLQRRGYAVVQAGTTQEAIASAATTSIDLVISDIGLPDGTGLEVMSRLRAVHGLNGIALSAYGTAEDIAQSKAAGFLLHLTKPVVADALADIVAAYFAMTRAGRTALRGR